MIFRSLVAALALLAASSAHAQRTFEPAIPRGFQDQPAPSSGELAPPPPPPAGTPRSFEPTVPQLVQNNPRTMSDADARHCLARASNKDIHRCAQPYLGRSARASVRRASAKAPAARQSSAAATASASTSAKTVAEPPRTPDTIKAAPPRPADTAKAADLVKPMDVTKSGSTPRPIEPPAKAADAPKPPSVGPKLPAMGSAADPTAAPPAGKASK